MKGPTMGTLNINTKTGLCECRRCEAKREKPTAYALSEYATGLSEAYALGGHTAAKTYIEIFKQ
jgi:hypothetical protein